MSKNTMLITGGTGKLGRIFSNHFANKGWRVIITSTSEARAKEFKSSVMQSDNIDFIICDLTEPNAPEKLIKTILDKGFEVNHLVNNARALSTLKVGSDGFSRREEMTMEYLLDVIVPYELSTKLYLLQKDSLNTIVNIGSQYGSVAPNPALYSGDSTKSPIQYSLAKSALHHLTKELSVRFSSDNIRVNCIAYGGIKGRVDSSFLKRYSELVPMGRMLNEDEVIGPLEFLVTNSSSSITGHIIAADGGWTVW